MIAPGSPAEQDPGHSSVLPGAAWEARGDYRDAELHYLRTLEDRAAPPERRARAMHPAENRIRL